MMMSLCVLLVGEVTGYTVCVLWAILWRGALYLQNVQTDGAVCIYIGMKHGGQPGHSGRLDWVLKDLGG